MPLKSQKIAVIPEPEDLPVARVTMGAKSKHQDLEAGGVKILRNNGFVVYRAHLIYLSQIKRCIFRKLGFSVSQKPSFLKKRGFLTGPLRFHFIIILVSGNGEWGILQNY